MLPFRAALFAGGAGGGGGPPAGGDLQTIAGNGNWISQSSTNTSNGTLIKITTPAGPNSALSSVFASFSGFVAGVSVKALLVADSGGSPANGVPLAIGSAVTPGTSADTNLVVELPFASAPSLSPSSDYWIGFVPTTTVSVVVADANFSNTASMEVVVSYASPSWNAASDFASQRYAIWAHLSQAGVATGLHHQGSTQLFSGAAGIRMILPASAVGDTVRVNFIQDFGTMPTTPSGWTRTYNDVINGSPGAQHAIYTRVIDGTENGTFYIDAPSGNQRTAIATVFRGGGAEEGKVTNTGAGTSATSAAVTTLGVNRRAYNFLVSGLLGGGASNTESADTWTDVYSLGTLSGSDYTLSLSYKDVASAGSSGTETRTISNGWWHFTSLAIPDA